MGNDLRVIRLEFLRGDRPRLRPAAGYRKWEIADTIELYAHCNEGRQYYLRLDPPTRTNFGTIPVLLRFLVQSTKPSQSIPCTLHDGCVAEHQTMSEILYQKFTPDGFLVTQTPLSRLPWDVATQLFNLLLKHMGEKDWRRRLLVAGVRLYGALRRRM